MKNYKLMIIDDELRDRKGHYDNIFKSTDFDIQYIGKLSELTEDIKNTPVDGYVVDAILDKGDWGGVGNASKLFRNILNKTPRRAPVFLVSGQWHEPSLTEILTEINQNQNNVDVVRFLAFQEFEQAAKKDPEESAEEVTRREAIENALRSKIQSDLSIWHEYSDFNPGLNDPIRILLLADLQYGDEHTSKYAVFDEQWVGKALNRCNLMPDIIVIAGDVSWKGEPSEYRQAREKIEGMIRFMFGDDRLDSLRERILLVPGNHDVNLRIAACEGYNWERDEKKWNERNGEENSDSGDQMNEPIVDYRGLALEPFRQFAHSLTGSRVWGETKPKCRVDRRFEHCGLRFFLFNSISHLTVNSPTHAQLDDRALQRITSELGVQDDPEDYFNFAISHHGIRAGEAVVQIDNWAEVGKQYFKELNIHIWMFGHYHKNSTYPISEAPFNKPHHLNVVQAATLKIRPGEGDTRGFSVIELMRENGKVDSVEHHFWGITDNGVGEKETSPIDL